MIPSYLSRYTRSEPNDEDRIRLYQSCVQHGVVVLRLDLLSDMDRAFAERLHADQIATMKRELQAYSNVRSIR